MSATPLFDLPQTPLEPGITLIEASAGTGKTFTIAGLFLRLLLERGVEVQQILVVTYTKAATAELRDRVRRKLAETRRALEAAADQFTPPTLSAPDPLLARLIARPEAGRREALQRLDLALENFDEAPIYTIHGFCQRTLHDRAFESGSLFDEEVLTDQRALLLELLEDFWRQQLYPAGPLLTALALAAGRHPEAFAPLAETVLRHPKLRIYSAAEGRTLAEVSSTLEKVVGKLRQTWRAERAAIQAHFGSQAKWAKVPYNRGEEMAEKFRLIEACLGESPRWTMVAVTALKEFATSALAEGTRKNAAAPKHHFFELCETLKQTAGVFTQALDREAVEFVRRELPRRLAERKLQSFDALLSRLHSALTGPGGTKLTQELRGQFAAALIDEFQDTDPVQYEIFHRVFATPDHFLFLIGDPKQAIYGFRGADVFTYLRAAGDADRRFTLGANWRSESALVRATNTLFGGSGRRYAGGATDAGEARRRDSFADSGAGCGSGLNEAGGSGATAETPFVIPRIHFQPVAARGAADRTPFTLDGQALPPLEVWFARRGGEESSIAKGRAEEALFSLTAGEIARLLQGQARLGDHALRPEDIAVLVPANRQAISLQAALRARGLPSVLQTTGSVFESPECEELRRVLAAFEEPGREAIVRSALATDLLGCSGNDLDALGDDDAAWQARVERFRAGADRWAAQGFIVMFRRWLHEEAVLSRLLAFPDGERRLTNVLHLGELFHAACEERRLNPSGLLKWLADRKADQNAATEEAQLRLETDEHAVRLVTIHRSKGLEYPVVFVPFAWTGAEKQNRRPGLAPEPFYDEAGCCLGLDLGSADAEAHRRLALRDRLAELVRLFYVAVTRARHRCTFVWGGFKSADSSAPAWLLHPPATPGDDPVAALQSGFEALDDGALLRRLEQLATASKDDQGRSAIAIRPLSPAPSPEAVTAQPTELDGRATTAGFRLSARSFTGSISHDWRVTSFSALTARAHDEQPDYDAWPQPAPGDESVSGLFAFPRGAAAGTCLHKIFERLDFTAEADTAELVRRELRAAGMALEWEADVCALLERVLSVPLDGLGGSVRLGNVKLGQRLNELEFCFPLARISAAGLGKVLGQPELSFDPVCGLLKGFIDLVFEHGGRFYIVDWKSNWLGGRVEDYHAAALAAEMARQHYDLQALLYTVALDRYLRLRRPGYDFDRDFGGVFYVFLRGVEPARPELGIHRLRPEPQRVESLGTFFARGLEKPTRGGTRKPG